MSDRDLMIGQAIGRYVIRSKLAEGGMGAVYVAAHERLPNAKKVVKVLLEAYSRNEVIRQRFEREATAASRLKHRHIITIDDFGMLPDGQLFLMMPFLDGKTLDTHIRQNLRLTQHHTLHVMVQVCRALQHLHDAGIVHRDLKPGNIFISETEDNPYEVTLIDLGIARDLAEDDATAHRTQTGMAMGTPGYMAVEQYGHAGTATAAADVYAAAIITWEMLTGQLPWGMRDPRVLYHAQMTEPPEPPVAHDVPPDLLALLRESLSVRPEDRPASARAFAVAFASLTPPIPPHVPSGADILVRFAREFVSNAAPDMETVRNASNSDQAAHVLWPYRSTQLPPLPSEAPISALPSVVSPTVNERPAVAPALAVAKQTTLSGSNGVSTPPEPTRPRRPVLALLAVGGALVAGAVTFAVARVRSHGSVAEPSAPVDIDAARGTTAAAPPRDAGTATPIGTITDASPDAPVVVAMPIDAAIAATKIEATKPATRDSPKRRSRVEARDPATTPTGSDRGSASRRGSGATFDPEAVEE